MTSTRINVDSQASRNLWPWVVVSLLVSMALGCAYLVFLSHKAMQNDTNVKLPYDDAARP